MNEDISEALLRAVRNGASFLEFAEQRSDAVDYGAASDLLAHAVEVSRGVVITENMRQDKILSTPDEALLDKEGLPLSPYLSFGETIALFRAEELGLGPNWPVFLNKKLIHGGFIHNAGGLIST